MAAPAPESEAPPGPSCPDRNWTNFKKLLSFSMNFTIDDAALKSICYAKMSDFEAYPDVTTISCPGGLHYHYIDRGSKILAVAHLDTVQQEDSYRRAGNKIYSPKLDDRLGVHIILDVLPKLGIDVDVLLTEGEETGESTAAFFQPSRHYNWMVEFDRAGEDVVLYQYQDDTLVSLLQHCGFRVGEGTSSDIAYADIGCKGINIGIGYARHHSKDAYFEIDILERQIFRFAKFHGLFAETRLIHDPRDRFQNATLPEAALVEAMTGSARNRECVLTQS